MKPSKKRKGNSDEPETGSFSTMHMSADEFRKQLQESEPLHYIKDYFFSNKDEDNVTNYIKAGGSIAEIAEALSKIDLKRREQSAVIFNALHLVVLRSITDFPDQIQFRDECKQFISNYSGELQAMLSSKTILKNKKIVLKLLASIAVVSTGLANQILTALSLSKEDLDLLSSHTDPLDDQTLRVSYIHFLLAFIVDQSPKVIEKLLMKKTWLPAIIPGLRYDSSFIVNLVLTSLEEQIVNNTSISKTAKIQAFNATSLYYLSELYTWNPKGWYDSNPQKTFTGEFQKEELSSIQESVHQLLLKVCTSSKTGIVFQDSLYGTSNTQKNYTLCNFLQKLSDPWEDCMKKELLHKTLIMCPDIIKPVINSTVPSLKQFSSLWLEIVNFFCDVINNVNINLADQPLDLCSKIIQDIIVPNIILEVIKSGKHLKTENESQMLCCVNFISRALKKYLAISKHIKKDLKDYSTFQANLSAYFVNNLPNTVELLARFKSAYINKQEELVKEMVQLFILYENICPELVDIIRFDDTVSKWAEEETRRGLPENEMSLVLHLVRLEIIVSPLDPLLTDYLKRLKYATANGQIKEIGLDVIKHLLIHTGFFISSPKELDLWMYCFGENFGVDIGPLLGTSMKWGLRNTSRIYKNLLKAQEHSNIEEVNDLNLDDFLQLSINDEDAADLEERSVSSILQLSPLLSSILFMMSETDNIINDDFLVTFIVHYLHQLGEVRALISLLKTYMSPFVRKYIGYFESWLDVPRVLNFAPFSGTVFSCASQYILNPDKPFSGIALDKVDAELLLEECCFMACELSKLNQATSERLERIVEIVSFCLNQEGLQVNLNRPALLSDFHPLRNVGDSDLTHLIMVIAEHTNLSESALAPFSHRLAFELKFTKKLVYKYKDKDKIKKLLEILTFSPSDIKDLMTFVFSMKNKYFQYNGELSPWILVINHLLTLSKKYNLVIKEDDLISLLSSLGYLSNRSFELSETYSVVLDYLKTFYLEVSAVLMDALKDLFYTLSSSTHWHKELCIYLHNYVEKVDYSQIPLERTITLIASSETFTLKHSKAVADSSGVIYRAFCERPSPEWVIDVKKIISILSPETCSKICKKVKKHHKDIYVSVESLSAMEDIFSKAEELYTLYSLVMSWFQDAMKSPESTEQSQREEMCRVLGTTISSKDLSDRSTLEKADTELLMCLLLQGLKLPSAPMLDIIQCFTKYSISKLPPGEIFDLLSSHSCFIDVLLGKSDAKYSLVNLMLELLSLDSSLIQATHVPILLSSYKASLSKIDQLILKLLQLYEKVGCINLACWKPYVWGEAAIDHYSIRSKISPLKPNPVITLELFEKDMVHRTITNFPLDRSLEGDSDLDDSEIYDPAFYLPLLSQLVGETTSAGKVAGTGVIGLTLAALASSERNVRAAAYHVLHRFYQSLDDFKDNLIWKNFIETLQGGFTDSGTVDNLRVSSIVTTFLARASIIMNSPDDPLYFTIHNFIYAKPHLKLNSVPAFMEMFHCHTNQRLHQRWILDILRDGIREQSDLQLALNCLIFKFILDYHSCSLASPKIKELIEALIIKCIRDIDKKQLLINNYSIIPWMITANCNLINEIPKTIRPEYKPLVENYQNLKVA